MATDKQLKILLIAQQKGGVGKTTIAKMLGTFAAREDLMNQRVLLIDFDYQASLSKLLLDMDYSEALGTRPPIHPEYNQAESGDWNGRSSSADIFFDGECYPYPVQHPYPVKNLHILPSSRRDLELIEEQTRDNLRQKVYNRLFEFLSLEEVRSAYDLVVIDTGPKVSALVQASLRAATHMITPIVMERQCLDGLAEMLAIWRAECMARPDNRQLILSGLLVNLYDHRLATHRAYLGQLSGDPTIGPLMCETIIPRRAAVTERDAKNIAPATLFDLPKSSDVRTAALQICQGIYAEIFPELKDKIAAIEPDRKYARYHDKQSASTPEAA